MCGIFGIITGPKSKFNQQDFYSVIKKLFVLSETRGKDASGLMLLSDENLTVLKRPLRAKELIKTREFVSEVKEFSLSARVQGTTLGFMGHARMVTNGSEETHDNNQPVLSHGMCMLHNGIIVNDVKLWNDIPEMERQYEVDTEVAINLIWHYRQINNNLFDAFYKAFAQLQGANSLALVSADADALILATSNGSLYFVASSGCDEIIFASEKYILEEILKQPDVSPYFQNSQVIHIDPGVGYYFDFNDLKPNKVILNQPTPNASPSFKIRKNVRILRDIRSSREIKSSVLPRFSKSEISENNHFVESVNQAVSILQRCTKCILPETFPY
ncbi:MAG: hypothetical protein IT235_04395, partial [Bacteroidia bacterium]|nr:hypothetical protein [Bacteroidia bacterium]